MFNITTLKYAGNPQRVYTIGQTADIFAQHKTIINAEPVYCRTEPHEFNMLPVLEQIKEFIRIIYSNYIIEKPCNFYAIIRSATSKDKILNELSSNEEFFKDKNATNSGNTFTRLGNMKNLVFYHCPVYTDLTKYHVDIGVKFNNQIIIPNSRNDGLAFTVEFNRKVIKDYRTFDNPLDFSKKKKNPSEITTEVMKKQTDSNNYPFMMTREARERLEKYEKEKRAKEETTKIIGMPGSGFDIMKQTVDTCFGPTKVETEGIKPSVPLHALPIEEQIRLSNIVKKNSEIVENIPKPNFTLTNGNNEISITEKLRNEYKKIDEFGDYTKSAPEVVEVFSPSISNCDYDTKAKAFENVGKDVNLPTAFMAAAKGFYKKETNENIKLRNLSDESILLYKLDKMFEYEKTFEKNNIYSKEEVNNLHTYRTAYIKHHLLYENNIPFILVDTDEVCFNFYGDKIEDKQKIQEKMYFSIRSLVHDLKEQVKNNILFVKNISPDDYTNMLTPSTKCRNEYLIKCYFLPKNKF